ncbi:MAG: GMC oxidoreductase [Candidatus Eisenbacteria bacterium]
MIHEHVVVGSGISGAAAARALIEGGARVLMLDGGLRDETYAPLVPADDWLTLRASDPEQHRYFLGDRFEGVPWGAAAHTLTPPRGHVARDTERLLPLAGEFARLESLAYGGLGAAWGAGCAVFTPAELAAAGFDSAEIGPAYEEVGRRIGLAAEPDDITDYCGRGLSTVQPPLAMDASGRALFAAYAKHRAALRAGGVAMGKMPMAVLTRPLGERGANPYTDMEFWADHEGSVYRPWMTVDELRKNERFEYRPGRLVTHFAEEDDHVVVRARRIDTSEEEVVRTRRLVLGSGTLGTARLVLRSQEGLGERPLLTNPYTIAPCLHLRRLGRALDRSRTSLGQVEMMLDPGGDGRDVRMVSIYTYRSLLLFKLVKEAPLGLADSLAVLRRLVPALLLVTINHPDRPGPGKAVRRVADADSPTGDGLAVRYARTAGEEQVDEASERRILAAMRRLGAPALKRQRMAAGSSVHYAGTLPFGDGVTPGTIARDGRLAGTRRVHVVDGSPFLALPGNGLTFTLMAWAHVVARRLAARGADE